jgi:hypothetical protein
MSISGEGTQEHIPERIQDFIFSRELAEVYLLLDHLSGRSDKSLAAAIGDNDEPTGRGWIQKICEIGWPPKGTAVEQAAQAATLLMAKDKLNFAAKPANGASIAFTLLVAGDDDATGLQPDHGRGPCRWLGALAFWRSPSRPPKAKFVKPAGNPPKAADSESEAGKPNGNSPAKSPEDSTASGNAAMPSGGIWGNEPPSRTSLARLAYPGLVSTAHAFNMQIQAIILFLVIWLIFTCVLSWDIAAGHAILSRLDGVETARLAIQKRIADAEIEEVKRTPPTPAADGKSQAAPAAASTTAAAVAPAKLPIQRYCERPGRLPPPPNTPPGVKIDQFEDATQRQICDLLAENRINYAIVREDIADWLVPWGWLRGFSRLFCDNRRCVDAAAAVPAEALDQQQWASVLVEVLATAVLPLCYGFLGAGAAVVRNIWGKMRDSLLSPRDFTLSVGQLALGAVIGACIGLFVTPSGTGAQGAAALTTGVTLTPSALSFIAGFGVEGVFVALESLIKRIFNIPDPKP